MVEHRNNMSHRKVFITKKKLNNYILNTKGLGDCTNQFILDNHYTNSPVNAETSQHMQYILTFLADHENLFENELKE